MAAPPPTSSPTALSSATVWQWHLAETYKGLITLSVEALKILALVNGGAAVAVLTYLGNLVSHAPAVQQPEIKPALLWYCGGLAATLFAFLVAYATQLRLYGEERARHEQQPFRTVHTVGIIIAWLLALSSAVAFGAGSWSAATALAGQPANVLTDGQEFLACTGDGLRFNASIHKLPDHSAQEILWAFDAETPTHYNVTEQTDLRYTGVSIDPGSPTQRSEIQIDRLSGTTTIFSLSKDDPQTQIVRDFCEKKITEEQCGQRMQAGGFNPFSCFSCLEWRGEFRVTGRTTLSCEHTTQKL